MNQQIYGRNEKTVFCCFGSYHLLKLLIRKISDLIALRSFCLEDLLTFIHHSLHASQMFSSQKLCSMLRKPSTNFSTKIGFKQRNLEAPIFTPVHIYFELSPPKTSIMSFILTSTEAARRIAKNRPHLDRMTNYLSKIFTQNSKNRFVANRRPTTGWAPELIRAAYTLTACDTRGHRNPGRIENRANAV